MSWPCWSLVYCWVWVLVSSEKLLMVLCGCGSGAAADTGKGRWVPVTCDMAVGGSQSLLPDHVYSQN